MHTAYTLSEPRRSEKGPTENERRRVGRRRSTAAAATSKGRSRDEEAVAEAAERLHSRSRAFLFQKALGRSSSSFSLRLFAIKSHADQFMF